MKKYYQLLFVLAVVFAGCGLAPKGDCIYNAKLDLGAATNAERQQIKRIIEQRLDGYGFLPADFNLSESGKILNVTVKNCDCEKDGQAFNGLLTSSGALEFWETYENEKIYPYIEKADQVLAKTWTEDSESINKAKPVGDNSHESSNPKGQENEQESSDTSRINHFKTARAANPLFVVLAPAIHQQEGGVYMLSQGPIVGYAFPTDTAAIINYISRKEVAAVFPYDLKFAWSQKEVEDSKMLQVYALKEHPLTKGARLSGDIISNATKQEQEGLSTISMTMKPEPAVAWQQITKENINRSIAIMMDGKVLSAPIVLSEITGGQSSITADFSQQETEVLVILLTRGVYPVRPVLVHEEMVRKDQH